MGSWIEELDRREAAAKERIDGLRRQIAELTERLSAEENLLSRLEVTQETMAEILAGTGGTGEPEPRGGWRRRGRGWLHEPAPGLFTLARQSPSGGGAGRAVAGDGLFFPGSGVRPHPNRLEEEPSGTV